MTMMYVLKENMTFQYSQGEEDLSNYCTKSTNHKRKKLI